MFRYGLDDAYPSIPVIGGEIRVTERAPRSAERFEQSAVLR